ncbi:MAG: ribonuclease R [Streptococcaceae bacterium]|nr:ribonuclease R [Streptococcaceae bacterium]
MLAYVHGWGRKLEEKILKFLQTVNKRLTMEELANGLELNSAEQFKEVVRKVAELERSGKITFNKKGKLSLTAPAVLVEGIFRAHEKGFGFVTIDQEEADVFIPVGKTNFALDGDRVLVDITKPARPFGDLGAEGEIVEVISRALTRMVGVFHAYEDAKVKETDLFGTIQPKGKKISKYTLYVAAMGIRPTEGEVVIAEITHYPNSDYPTMLEGVVKQTIGHVNDPGMDILEVIHSHGIPVEFPEEVQLAANKVPDEIDLTKIKGRKDLRDQVIVTIDGSDAKDLDDAVTVWVKDNGNYHLGVHIADVSYYVTENSPIDVEAAERGTSVYLTDRVIPMIPHRLSNGICSLNPKVPRFTMSCEMEINLEGKVVDYEIFPSIIQTTERMTYDSVNKILEDDDEDEKAFYSNLVDMFGKMKDLHQLLESMRTKRGAISFEDHEAKVIVDETGKPLEIIGRTRQIGERLIESFMLIANETVAQHFSNADLPFIYRVHEHPKSEKLQRFFDFASAIGVSITGSAEKFESTDLQNVLKQIEGTPEEMVVNMMLLRSMQQARYSEYNYGHYGLGAEYYTHFTSPIRRYPDLMVHRLIREYHESTEEKRQEKWELLLPDIATHASQMERRAVDCEREVDSMKKAEYMQIHLGEEFEGVISSVAKFGFFVELPNTIEGLIHISTLEKDYYNYLEKHLALVGERSGQVFKIGQKVTVKVMKADPETKEIDFKLIDAEEVPRIETSSKRHGKRSRGKKETRPSKRKQTSGTGTKKKQGNSHEWDSKGSQGSGSNGRRKSSKKSNKSKNSPQPFYKKVAKKKKRKG